MTDTCPPDPPSPFIDEWVHRLAAAVPVPGRALDVAVGTGRHARILASAGYLVFGVDIRHDAVRDAATRLAVQGLTLRGWCADLTVTPLPAGRFDLVVVTRFLQRSLFPSLIETLRPGGVILYETFTEAQRGYGRGPTSGAHLLKSGELPSHFSQIETLFYEEATEPDALARLAARVPIRRS